MFNKEADLLKQIAQSRAAIREKHSSLKQDIRNVEDKIGKIFKPIIQPLNKIADQKANDISNLKKMKKVSFFHSTPHKLMFPGESDSANFNNNTNNIDKSADENDFEMSSTINPDMTTVIASSKNEISEVPLKFNLTKYLEMLENENHNNNDKTFGIRKKNYNYMIGDKQIDFEHGKIIIGDTEYEESPGLLELLFTKHPNDSIIKNNDVDNFKKIALKSNLLRKYFKPNKSYSNKPKKNANSKYWKYLDELMPQNFSTTGKGLPKFMTSYQQDLPIDYKY